MAEVSADWPVEPVAGLAVELPAEVDWPVEPVADWPVALAALPAELPVEGPDWPVPETPTPIVLPGIRALSALRSPLSRKLRLLHCRDWWALGRLQKATA